MDIESKMWNFSGTGTKVHAFIDGRSAACRKSIARPAGNDMDFCQAKQGFKFSVCTTCETRFNAAIERLENSLQPSTGEGDYLSPAAEEAPAAPCTGCVLGAAPGSHKDSCPALEGKAPGWKDAPQPQECGAQLKDPATGRVGHCIKPKGHGSQLYSEQTEARGHQMSPEIEEDSVTDDLGFPQVGYTAPKITPEVIEALRWLRHRGNVDALSKQRLDVLDNAGIFAAIDEATGYDVDPEPERVSKCTCPDTDYRKTTGNHHANCPGDPAEWGDMAYTTATAAENERLTRGHNASLGRKKDRRPCPADQCTLDFAVNKDGTLHKHLNDMLEPCPGVAPVQVGSDEWMTAMGAALAETPLYALRKTDNEES